MQQMPFGPLISGKNTTFRLWAPLKEEVLLKLDGREVSKMQRDTDGWHHLEVAHAGPGTRYSFILPDGMEVPDPASRFQPEDVHGPSEVIDPDHNWWSNGWVGRPWEEIVIYQLHVGTLSPEGTFLGVIDKLDHLADLGITALQLLPIAAFPGDRNWGYDGVLPYAPDSSYGRPQDLKRLIDEAHLRGLCVFLDVVYNHFGPDGNYMSAYAPLFTDRHKTPWGDGINYDGPQSEVVREFIIGSALTWIEEFRVDGLRLDAVHAIEDDSDRHVLHEITERVREAAPGRHVHLMAENEENDAALLERREDGSPRWFTAQWNDDVHHALHVAGTGETFGYYGDYADALEKLGRSLAEGFAFQGEHMPYRDDARGTPSAHLPPTAFIAFLQNHDQIGNRAAGDRIAASRPPEVLKALAAITLLSPQIPMLFMGEEWGAQTPFPYFCDFHAELNAAVRQGRREELSRLPGFDGDDAPDPTARETFESARLDWRAMDQGRELLDLYRDLIALRHRTIVPALAGTPGHAGQWHLAHGVLTVTWQLRHQRLRLDANLSNRASEFAIEPEGEVIFRIGERADGRHGPWSVVWSMSPGS